MHHNLKLHPFIRISSRVTQRHDGVLNVQEFFQKIMLSGLRLRKHLDWGRIFFTLFKSSFLEVYHVWIFMIYDFFCGAGHDNGGVVFLFAGTEHNPKFLAWRPAPPTTLLECASSMIVSQTAKKDINNWLNYSYDCDYYSYEYTTQCQTNN